jgi:outer membrane protein assembly factor BamB
MKAAAFLFALVATVSAGDWLHYRGPKHDGSTAETLDAFPQGAPRELWRAKLGIGLSSVTVAGDRLFSAGYKDGSEVLICLDVRTGKPNWTRSWPAKLGDYLFEGGPRATPTVDGDRVYMVGADGHVACLQTSDGKVVWEKELVADFGGKRMDWGFCSSPTIDGENVLLDCGAKGASTIALNKKTGAVVWKAGDDEPGYGSVHVAVVDGRRTAIVFKAEALVGHDAENGKVLWRFEWQTAWKVNAVTPLVVGDLIIISSAYQHGAAAVRVKGGKAEQVWFTKKLQAQFNSPVQRDGYLYAIDGEVAKRSALVCLDAKTGDEKWRAREVKNGSLILAGNRLLVLTEIGELLLVEASSGSYTELSREKVLSGRCWVQPVLANGRIFCRNNEGELVALVASAK